MGVYDCYEDIQLKVGECVLRQYKIGDKVGIPDGVYIAPDGAVVIKDRIFIMTTTNIQDKWGDLIDVNDRNPVMQVLKNRKEL